MYINLNFTLFLNHMFFLRILVTAICNKHFQLSLNYDFFLKVLPIPYLPTNIAIATRIPCVRDFQSRFQYPMAKMRVDVVMTLLPTQPEAVLD